MIGVSYSRLLAGVALLALMQAGPAAAETMSSALARAYRNNPDINQQRAATRAADENVPIAKSGWLPKASVSGQAGHQYTESTGYPGALTQTQKATTNPGQIGATVSQTLFDGNQTANRVSGAESGVLAQREALRSQEISTLQSAATAYMDVLRDTAVLGLRRNNISVLQVQLQQTRDRFQVGEVTRTDVAQAESSLATGRADYAVAQANLERSVATFRQQIGVDPKNLAPAQPVERLLPKTPAAAIAIGLEENPQITSALHQVDAAESAVKTAEGALLPTVGVQGTVSRSVDSTGVPNYNINTASVVGVLNVPLYQGGQEYATIRQYKEKLGQARLLADSQRVNVRAGISTTWGQLQSAKAAIIAFQAAVKAAEVALNGVREEAKVGQRTTLDVLNAQQTLLNTRVQLVSAQRDRVVASYAVLAQIGRLSANTLGLNAPAYDPGDHYERTKNRFIGLTASDGS
ncbi:outer membrane protein [Rhodoblastus acidophilus]|uniref:TolC family outer membrane protein n=1 Tax=Rhodoblastus acidophilus TaxID=1074 RepID=UPI0022257336|nr:TolC family outer membrane protein [Rhodoblastus acidophilus]MCW2284082.1 outer membrane protein [Rhodoblastus acidophilus]MCW2332778.1 outer membrane protein [Rhodoblastus acidophilus]